MTTTTTGETCSATSTNAWLSWRASPRAGEGLSAKADVARSNDKHAASLIKSMVGADEVVFGVDIPALSDIGELRRDRPAVRGGFPLVLGVATFQSHAAFIVSNARNEIQFLVA